MKITHRTHGIPFHRSGTCDRCPDHDKPPCGCKAFGEVTNADGGCPHFAVADGANTCLIYDQRDKHCAACWPDKPTFTHQVCIDFPDHPWLHVIKSGVCSYTFTRVDESGKADSTPLPFM